jgi:hypothetical protein
MEHGARLSERDDAILEFEGSWWLYPGPKDRAIREYLGMSSTRYYQAIRRLMDDPAARVGHPLVIRRLRRMRDERIEQIAARLSGGDSVG